MEGIPPFSVIIPVFNEEKNISGIIRRMRYLESSLEIIVVDARSQDSTLAIARKEGVKVLSARKARGAQCNAGAYQAKNPILLFVHADTYFPDNAFLVLREYFSKERIQIAKFRLRFDSGHWFLNICSFFTRFDSLWTSFGDQCIAVRRDFFNSMGGFPDWPLFEDVEFFRRARRKTKVHSMPATVSTCGRKFMNKGPIRQQLKNAVLILKYLMGMKPSELAKEYER